MKATSFSSSISANLGNSGEAMVDKYSYFVQCCHVYNPWSDLEVAEKRVQRQDGSHFSLELLHGSAPSQQGERQGERLETSSSFPEAAAAGVLS